MVLAIVMALIFVIGFFLDFIEITFIHVPVLAPIMIEFGFDPVWFCILIAVNLQTSFMTPPFGFSLFYLKAVTPPEISTGHIYRGIIPFVIVQIIGLAIVVLFPQLATWLPKVVFGHNLNRQPDRVSITPPLTKEASAMKRRDFLKKAGVGAAAVAATTVNAPAVLGEKNVQLENGHHLAAQTAGAAGRLRTAGQAHRGTVRRPHQDPGVCRR
jgi:hypothetical protein